MGKHKSNGATALKVEGLVCFLSSFDPHIANIWRALKRYKICIKYIGKYCKNIENIESIIVATLASNALPFFFCLKEYSET